MSSGATALAVTTLWQREMVRFFRQRSRVIGSLGTPLIFWLMVSSGLGPSFRPPSAELGAFEYFFPGSLLMLVLFTSIFANISVIEDRHEGFLQGVLVAPVPRRAIVLGKILGGTTVAVLQAVVLLALAALGGIDVRPADPIGVVASVVLLALALSAVGFAFAWRLDSVQGFHGVMNLVLLPMWVLSGALFPAAGLPWLLHAAVMANPATYGLAWMRHGLGIASPELPSAAVCAAVTVGFTMVALAAAGLVAAEGRRAR